MSSDYQQMAGAYGRHRTEYEPLVRELAKDGRLTETSRVLEIGAGTADYVGLRRLKTDLARGPMVARGHFALLWATK
jgi:hypothetical protein